MIVSLVLAAAASPMPREVKHEIKMDGEVQYPDFPPPLSPMIRPALFDGFLLFFLLECIIF